MFLNATAIESVNIRDSARLCDVHLVETIVNICKVSINALADHSVVDRSGIHVGEESNYIVASRKSEWVVLDIVFRDVGIPCIVAEVFLDQESVHEVIEDPSLLIR